MKPFLLALSFVVFSGGLSAQSVQAVLARMDQAAPKFHDMTANVQMVTYTAIIGDKMTENGTLKMQRLKSSDVRAIIDFSQQPDSRVIAFLGKIVRIYYPNLKSYQDYEVGKNSDVLNQFLLLGFGSSGRELAQSYDITMEGQEKVAGQDTTKLLLVPKDPNVKDHLTKIEMWVPNDKAYPVRQQFYEPSGNYREVTYTDIQINPHLPQRTLELNLPKGVKRQS